jgi:hypothetical protein
MKAPESVKEKAMIKFKEIKGRPDEGSLKAKQYIEGLLKLPFGIYRQEPILKRVKEFNRINQEFVNVLASHFPNLVMKKKTHYTILEIYQNIKQIQQYIIPNTIQSITETLSGSTNKKIHGIVQFMNNALKSRGSKKLPVTQTKQNHIQTIQQVLSNSPQELVYEVYDNAHATDNDTFSLK